jgi:polysaccharide biosynthesis protein VpsJ
MTSTVAPSDQEWALGAALAIWSRLAARAFAGWDPYDALNATRLPGSIKNARLFRRALTQAVKRSPLPLQPLIGVKQQADAYTLGHALLAAARLTGLWADSPGATGVATAPNPTPAGPMPSDVTSILEQLRSMASRSGGQMAWGYHFPVHTRFFSYVPPTPNLIVTAFVSKGLAAVTRAGLADCSADLRGAVTFILEGLPRVSDETGQCIGYVPGEEAVVHNANMLAVLVLCEAAQLLAGEPAAGDWLNQAIACARFTAARQEADGSWPYSEESDGRWVDGFHTGFVLEGLARLVRALHDTPAEVAVDPTVEAMLETALARGVRYYVAQLFGPDGEPKYYPAKAHPYDALSASQGVETLHAAIGGHAAQAVPDQVAWIRDHLVDSDGRVAYQVHKRWTDRREFPRWAGAPMMSALAGVAALTPAAGNALAIPHGAPFGGAS